MDIGSDDTWEEFVGQWNSVLATPPKISFFHAAEAESRKGQFEGFSVPDRDAKIDELIKVIQCLKFQPVYVRVRQQVYLDIVKDNVPKYWDNPYYCLFMAFIAKSVILVRDRFGSDEPIKFIFDKHDLYKKTGPKFYNSLRLAPSMASALSHDVHYQSDEDCPPLQAADLLAWQVRRAFCVTSEPRRKHFEAARCCPKGFSFFRHESDQRKPS